LQRGQSSRSVASTSAPHRGSASPPSRGRGAKRRPFTIAETSARAVGPIEASIIEDRTAEVGCLEAPTRQVGTGEIDATEIELVEHGLTQYGARERRLGRARAAQTGARQIGSVRGNVLNARIV
jgi:hypothetical protein